MYACQKKLATFKAKRNNISNDFQVLKRFIHTSGRETNTHHIPKIFVYIYEAKSQVGLDETRNASKKVTFFLYINDFEATRRFLEALKTAGDS